MTLVKWKWLIDTDNCWWPSLSWLEVTLKDDVDENYDNDDDDNDDSEDDDDEDNDVDD